MTFNGTAQLSALVLSEIQVEATESTGNGMESDQCWKIGVLKHIRPSLRTQLTPMIGLNLLLTMSCSEEFQGISFFL